MLDRLVYDTLGIDQVFGIYLPWLIILAGERGLAINWPEELQTKPTEEVGSVMSIERSIYLNDTQIRHTLRSTILELDRKQKRDLILPRGKAACSILAGSLFSAYDGAALDKWTTSLMKRIRGVNFVPISVSHNVQVCIQVQLPLKVNLTNGLEKNQREDLRWIWGSCCLHGKQNCISRLLGYRPPSMVATDRISGPFSFMTASNQGLIFFLYRQLWVFSIHTWQKSKLPTVTRITHWKSRAWLLQIIIWCPRLWLSPFLGNCFAQVLKEVKLLFT